MVVAAVFGLIIGGLYQPQPRASMQDISNVKILVTAPYGQLNKDGFFLDPNPYRLHIYITLKIVNPTSYDVLLRVRGEANITLSGQMSGNYELVSVRDINVQRSGGGSSAIGGYYEIFLYTGNTTYSDAHAVNVTFNDVQVTELWRGAGTPPPLPTPTPSILP